MAPRQHPFETQLHRQHVAASAASTALRVNPRASPSSKAAAASVALFREPRRRPAGFWNSRLRPCAGGRTISSLIGLLRRCCEIRVYIHGIWHCVNSNRTLGRHDPSQIRRHCGMAGSARRSLFASLKVLSGWSMTTATRLARPNAPRCPQGFMAEFGSATLCTEPGCPAAVLRRRAGRRRPTPTS